MNRSTRAATPRQAHRIELEGEWDLSRKDELKRLFDAAKRDGPLTIDLRRVTYADSTFLHLLATLTLRLQGVPITLLGAQPNLKRLFGITQFDAIFHIVDNE